MKYFMSKDHYSFADFDGLVVITPGETDDKRLGRPNFSLACYSDTYKRIKELLIGATKVQLDSFDPSYGIWQTIAIYDSNGESTDVSVMGISLDNHNNILDAGGIAEMRTLINELELEYRQTQNYFVETFVKRMDGAN